MRSTTQTPFEGAITSFTEAFTGMLTEATYVTRQSAEAYLKGIDALVEQQNLAR